ncbi:ArsA family ATPase [Corallococcus sp. RDP092CA]|uniref:ArsA family ATPase n=1 Tax=Corallococcus sp. RDP092CA TaxID=3109369 RepID=UPI0035B2F4B3
MARIIMISGKGGVGKTTVAAATGLAASQKGSRTLILSFDLAHSLADSFNLDLSLFDHNKGRPTKVADNLEIQEIDVAEELEREWSTIYQYLASLFASAGVADVVAEEVAILPGMEDVVALIFINRYINKNLYDTIVVDCPPTSESLRFVNITATLEWYVKTRFSFDRQVGKLVRPLLGKSSSKMGIPEDDYFNSLKGMFSELNGIQKRLLDPTQTTVRLVCNPEKMVIRETQRAYMYFNLYGMTTEMVVINRVMPAAEGYFSRWAENQARYCQEVNEYFSPVPVVPVPYFASEVMGMERLGEVVDVLYKKEDPTQCYVSQPSYAFAKEGDGYVLKMNLPFVDKRELTMTRSENDLVIRIGNFKRYVPLPTAMLHYSSVTAKKNANELQVIFQK